MGGEVRTATVAEIARSVPLAGAVIMVANEREAGKALDALHKDRGLDICRRCTVYVVGLKAMASVCAAYDEVVGKLGVGDVAFQTIEAINKINSERGAELARSRDRLVRHASVGSIILAANLFDGYRLIETVRRVRPGDRGKIRVIVAPNVAAVDRVLNGLSDGQAVYRDPGHQAKVDLGETWACWAGIGGRDGLLVARLPRDRTSLIVVETHERAVELSGLVRDQFGAGASLVNFLVAATAEIEVACLDALGDKEMPVFRDPRMPARLVAKVAAAPSAPQPSDAELALAAEKATKVEEGKRRARLRTGSRKARAEEMCRFVDGLRGAGSTVIVSDHNHAKHIREIIATARPEILRAVWFFMLPEDLSYADLTRYTGTDGWFVAPGMATACARREKRRASIAAQSPAPAPAAAEDAYRSQAATYVPSGGYIGLDRGDSAPRATRPICAPIPKPAELGHTAAIAGTNRTVVVKGVSAAVDGSYAHRVPPHFTVPGRFGIGPSQTLELLAKRIGAIKPTASPFGRSVTIPGRPAAGWICPRCETVLAPHVDRCTCKAGTPT